MTTESLCPHCLTKIAATYAFEGEKTYLKKTCPEHGNFKTLLWEGKPAWSSWLKEKKHKKIEKPFTQLSKGCPFDCGLCSDHRQETCTALIEVTQRCNLNCAVCFAAAGDRPDSIEPSLKEISYWYEQLLAAGGPYNVQLSGGEPTLRDDLPQIAALGRDKGFDFIQLNTNGLRLAADFAYLEQLKAAGVTSIFLQFDGSKDEIYQQLRGQALLATKTKAIENCAQLQLGVILVPTLVPGVNVDDIGEMIRFALSYQPTVRGIHFQPISYFGRYPAELGQERLTIPQLIREIAKQSEGQIDIGDFLPPGCENPKCSFHGNFTYRVGEGLQTRSIKDCCSPTVDDRGAEKARKFVSLNWSGLEINKAHAQSQVEVSPSWDSLLASLRSSSFSISGMAFQDAWDFDLQRIRDCCIHVVSREGNLIPFCAYNVTSSGGKALYRP